jgi:murein DD-endopeptidase MepM/ murein hydrolase activator NlpD
MARIFYRYNPETCKYEPIFHSRNHILGKTGRFLLVTFMIAVAGLTYLNFNHLSYNEITLKKDNEWLKWEWNMMQKKIEKTSEELAALENDDDNHYRVVLDMEKLDNDIRLGGAGGSQKYQLADDEKVNEVVNAYENLNKIHSRLEVENQSLTDIDDRVTRFDQMMASRPAMMPIDNRQITRFNTIFGMRMHPILNTWKHHNGLDLTADYGTPVYATGDGIVLEAKPGWLRKRNFRKPRFRI